MSTKQKLFMLRYVLCVIGAIIATVGSVFLVNWWVVLLADKDGNLPGTFKTLFQTFDDNLDAASRAGMIDMTKYVGQAFGTYLNRVYWLFRNPAYGFDYYVFGIVWNWTEWTVEKYEVTTDAAGATTTLFYATHPSGAFNYFHEGPNFSYKFGWKAWNHFDANAKQLSRVWGNTNDKIPLCFTPKFW